MSEAKTYGTIANISLLAELSLAGAINSTRTGLNSRRQLTHTNVFVSCALI